MRRGFDPMGPGGDGWWLAGTTIGTVLFLAAIAAIVWLIVRAVSGPRTDDPFRRAAARYAAGKIERVEFERIQRDLRTVGQVTPTEATVSGSPVESPNDT